MKARTEISMQLYQMMIGRGYPEHAQEKINELYRFGLDIE